MAHLLGAENIGIAFGTRTILEGLSLGVDEGDRIGLDVENAGGSNGFGDRLIGSEAANALYSYGGADTLQWARKEQGVDFFDVKGDVHSLLFPLQAHFVAASHPALHPGRWVETRTTIRKTW